MSKKILIWFLAIVFIGTGAYFLFIKKNMPSNARLIPVNASVVMSINLMQLGEKAEIQKVRKMNFAKQLLTEMSKDNDDLKTFLEKAIDNPEITGIDFRKNIYIFMDADEKNKTQSVGVTIKLNEREAFEHLLKKIIPEKEFKVKVKDSYWYVTPEKGTVIAWDEGNAIIFGGNREDLNNELNILMTDGGNDERLVSNKKFSAFAMNKADIGMFMDGSKFVGIMKSLPDFSGMEHTPTGTVLRNEMEMLKKIYDGMYLNFLVDFGKDKVTATARQEFDDPKRESEFAAFYGKKINPDLVNFIAPETAIAFMAGKIDLNSIIKFYEAFPEIDKALHTLADKSGMPFEKLKTFFSGDLSFALTDFKPIKIHKTFDEELWKQDFYESYYDSISRLPAPPSTIAIPKLPKPPTSNNTITETELMPVFTATIGVAEIAEMQHLLDKYLVKEKGYYSYKVPEGFTIYFVPDKPGITITNDSETAMILVDKGSFNAKLRPEITDIVKNNAFGFYADLVPGDLSEKTRNSIIEKAGKAGYSRAVEILAPFKNISARYSESESIFELDMNKSDHNSLFTIINHIDQQTSK